MCIFCCFLVSTVTAADCCFSHNALFHYAWFLCIFANHILLTHTLACTGTHVGRRTHTPIGEESDGYEPLAKRTRLGPNEDWTELFFGMAETGVVVGVPVVVACLFCTIALSWLSLSLSGLSLSTFATVSQNRCIGFQGNCDFLTQHSISKTCRGRNFSWAPKSVQWNHLIHFRLQNRNHTYEVIKNHRRFDTFK